MKTQTAAAPHPSTAELEGFALGSLDGARAAIVEGHVYRCDRCAGIVAKVPGDEFLQQLRSSSEPATSDGYARDLPEGIAMLPDRMTQKGPALRPQLLFGILALPVVWLPLLICLIYLMWLMLR